MESRKIIQMNVHTKLKQTQKTKLWLQKGKGREDEEKDGRERRREERRKEEAKKAECFLEYS